MSVAQRMFVLGISNMTGLIMARSETCFFAINYPWKNIIMVATATTSNKFGRLWRLADPHYIRNHEKQMLLGHKLIGITKSGLPQNEANEQYFPLYQTWA